MTKRNNPVNLTVHKNTLEKRRQRNLRRELMLRARRCSQLEDISGYGIIAFSAKESMVYVDPGMHRSTVDVVSRMHSHIIRDLANYDREQDS